MAGRSRVFMQGEVQEQTNVAGLATYISVFEGKEQTNVAGLATYISVSEGKEQTNVAGLATYISVFEGVGCVLVHINKMKTESNPVYFGPKKHKKTPNLYRLWQFMENKIHLYNYPKINKHQYKRYIISTSHVLTMLYNKH